MGFNEGRNENDSDLKRKVTVRPHRSSFFGGTDSR